MAVAPKAGLVLYRRRNQSLDGEWTHHDIGGLLAREVVKDVPEGAIEGDWEVDIFRPDGQIYWSGRLRSVKSGHALRFTWTGSFTENGRDADFVGIGLAIDDNLIVGTFEAAG